MSTNSIPSWLSGESSSRPKDNSASTSSLFSSLPATPPPRRPSNNAHANMIDLTLSSDSSPGSSAGDLSSPGSVQFVSPTTARQARQSPSQARAPSLFIGKRLQQGPRPPQHNTNSLNQSQRSVLGESTNGRASAGVMSTPRFESSAGAFAIGVKGRLTTELNESARRVGIPIGVPSNPPPMRSAYKPRFEPMRAPPDEDAEVVKAMGKMEVNDTMTPEQHEAALKQLVAETVDMSAVDTSDPPPKELECRLLTHQKSGLHWLRDRESGKKRGGILADDMGLGKTVQMIALICANRATKELRASRGTAKTTLIICPVSLMEQWKDELFNKTDGSIKCYIHHGPSRTQSWDKLRKYDVVITSYNTAASEWTDPKPRASKKDAEDPSGGLLGKKAKSAQSSAPLQGPLFDGAFWRIILDEAHQIKGRTTRMHKACVALESHYRWALSGTPVQNGVDDLFSLFEFLGKVVNPLHLYPEFKEKIATPLKNGRAKLAMARLQVVLKAVMLRRTKLMLVDGKPLLTLPKREVIEVKCPFVDKSELEFYEAVEAKMSLTMNAFLKNNSVLNNMTSVLILLLRMRQACSHPHLVTRSTGKDDKEGIELNPERNSAEATPKKGQTPADTPSRAPPPVELDLDGLDDLIGGMNALSVVKSPSKGSTMCSVCSKPASASQSGSISLCELCTSRYANLQFSTKILRCLRTLEEIRQSTKEGELPHKTIIFSQFTSMFDLLEPFLRAGKFRGVRFDGSMDTKKKAEALDKIRSSPKHTVILVSIKSGSVGLNLTCCSRVILLDLWWNPQIENQAFDRAHRFGQQRDVKIYKITIDGTIEDRILQLQTEKADIAKAALDGGDVSKGNKLSLKDVLYLFKGNGGDKEDQGGRREKTAMIVREKEKEKERRAPRVVESESESEREGDSFLDDEAEEDNVESEPDASESDGEGVDL